MNKIQITNEYLVNFLIDFNSHKNAHKDYIDLYQTQLDILLDILEIKGLIKLDASDKGNTKFIFKRLFPDYIRADIFNEESFEDLETTERVINWCINDLLDKCTVERTIRSRGQMTTFDDMETVHKLLNTRQKDYTINILNDSIVKLYKEEIRDCLRMLYSADSLYKKKIKDIKRDEEPEWDEESLKRVSKAWNINSYASESQSELLNKQLCGWDYM
jgi:hypothetical protein